jgi:phosphatidylethanolamine/phosphatidyl-N-methylethanolamine N-methyltransferase
MASWDLDTVKSIYGNYAGAYDWVCGWAFREGRKVAIDLMDPQPGMRVLEVGVGTGAALKHYPLTIRVSGIDISSSMLNEAKKRLKRENWTHVESLEVMNAESMHFENDRFDAVAAMHVATVVPDPARFMAEMRRVCKPGGKILIISYFEQKQTMTGRIASRVAPVLGKLLGFRANLSYEEFIDIVQIKNHRRSFVNLFRLWSIIEVINDKAEVTTAT